MSPKTLVALLLVGLCATQMASAYRHSREVQELMEGAEAKLNEQLEEEKDAARSSMETVMGFLQKMEKDVLTAASEKLAALGFPIDLLTLSELIKSNVNTCVTNDAVKNTADDIIGQMSSCVSKDVDSLKGLLKDMQGLWGTATNLPGSMMNVATQCSEHGQKDIKEDVMESEESDESDEPDHDLAPVVDAIAEEASKTRSKRWIWGFGRIARCCKSLYSLARYDLITIPGQMLSCASNAYGVVKSAASSTEIPKCIQSKVTDVLPVLKSVTSEVATCMSQFDVDAIMAGNPKLAGLKKMMDLAMKFGQMPTSALGTATAALGALGDGAKGGVAGSVFGGVTKLFG